MKMRNRFTLFIFCLILVNQSFSQTGKTASIDTTYEEIDVSQEEELVDPPPPSAIRHYPSISDWLTHICQGQGPARVIDEYRVDVFETAGTYILHLVGLKTQRSGNQMQISIVFEPEDMFLFLPEKDAKGLSRQQVFAGIHDQIRAFMGTDTYQQSFLAGTSIKISTGAGNGFQDH